MALYNKQQTLKQHFKLNSLKSQATLLIKKACNILKGLKFKTQFLPGVFLARGDTRAIFAFLGKTPFDMLLFIVFDNGAAKTPAANLTSFGGILQNLKLYSH